MDTSFACAACYCRLSKEDEADGDSVSIETQKQILTAYCKTHNISRFSFYCDDGCSGTNFLRPSFMRMLDDIEKGSINTVIVKDLSRFGRNYIETGYYLENYFPEKNVHFIALGDMVDSTNGYDELLVPIKNLFNQAYPADISKKIRQAFRSKAQHGEFLGSYAPYGYKKCTDNKNILEIDSLTEKNVKEIFRLAAYEGYGYKRIANTMRKNKVLTPCACRQCLSAHSPTSDPFDWNSTAVKKILNNQAYLGHTINSKTQKVSFKSKKIKQRPEEEWIIVKNTHPPIIPLKLWNDAHMRINSRKRICRNGEVHILSGLVYCADCGSTLSLCHNGNGEKVLSCTRYKQKGKDICSCHYIRFDDLCFILNEEIKSMLSDITLTDTDIDFILKNSISDSQKTNLNVLKKSLSDCKKRIHEIDCAFYSLYNDKLNKIISEEKFTVLSAKFEQEQKTLTEQAEQLEKQLSQNPQNLLSKSDINNQFLQIKNNPISERVFLHCLIDKVIVHEHYTTEGMRTQEIEIHYNGSLKEIDS